MQSIPVKTIALVTVTVLLLVAVIVTAVMLDRGNGADSPDDGTRNPAYTTSTPAASQEDVVEGSMGLGDNPFGP